MKILTSHEIAVILVEIGIIIGFSRFLGEIARRYRQPMVVGEILAGIILGPTFLCIITPDLESGLFHLSPNTLIVMEGLTTVAVALLLLVAGLEINLFSLWNQRKTAFLVSFLGIAFPFALGFGASSTFPGFFGHVSGSDSMIFAVFFGTAMSISALPVIAKTLMDMNLLKSDMGTLVMASAALNDLVGWLIFSIVVSLIAGQAGQVNNPYVTILLIILFTVFMLTVVRRVFRRILPWLERRTVWPGGILGFVFAFTMIGSAVTEQLGVHAVLGALLVGIAAGEAEHLTERTKDVITQFATNIFAPLFFAFIGLRINFAAYIDLPLIAAVFVIACTGKVVGCTLGAKWSGSSTRESLTIGFGMNSRGAMEIIISLLAFEYGLIGENLFVALVIMAVGTTMISGPVMGWLIHEKKPLKISMLLKHEGYVHNLKGATPRDIIRELANLAGREANLNPAMIFEEVWERERIIGTALGGGFAVPHARLTGIRTPTVVAGKSRDGVDFNAMDGAPVQVVFMILTPQHDMGAQLQILADIARIFTNPAARAAALKAENYRSFMNAIGLAPERSQQH